MTDVSVMFGLTLAYGQEVCETRRAPSFLKFSAMAKRRGVTWPEFEAWAKVRTWAMSDPSRLARQ